MSVSIAKSEKLFGVGRSGFVVRVIVYELWPGLAIGWLPKSIGVHSLQDTQS